MKLKNHLTLGVVLRNGAKYVFRGEVTSVVLMGNGGRPGQW